MQLTACTTQRYGTRSGERHGASPARGVVRAQGPARPADTIGGKFLLRRRIGKGSSGDVYEAEHLIVGKPVAIKVLHPSLARDPAVQSSFVAEARAAARIDHIHVVDIYDLGVTADGLSYLVMELIRGESLSEILGQRGAIGPAYACELTLQVLAGLGAAHSQGIVHRDLKPANVMVTHPRPDRPHVKLLDFGIATGIAKPIADAPDGMYGTPMYMAPEQALGQSVDERSDLYSVGAMLYEMLSGRPPFEGSGTTAVLAKVMLGKLRPLHQVAPAVDEKLVEVVERAMSLDPSQRPQTAEEFLALLRPFVEPGRAVSIAPCPVRSLVPIPLVNPLRRGAEVPRALVLQEPTPAVLRGSALEPSPLTGGKQHRCTDPAPASGQCETSEE